MNRFYCISGMAFQITTVSLDHPESCVVVTNQYIIPALVSEATQQCSVHDTDFQPGVP